MQEKKNIIKVLIIFYVVSIVLGVILIMRVPKRTVSREEKIKFSNKSKLSFTKKEVAVIYIYGPISVSADANPFFPGGTDRIVEKLKRIRKSPDIKAVVIRVNSPGGSVGAVQEVYEEINKLRDSGKKVVVSMGDVAASGGYYIACAADKVVANPGTITGSIGVIARLGNVQELFKKIGISTVVIKSGEHKDIGSPTRAMTEKEKGILQGLIDNSYNQFVEAVMEGRNKSYEEVLDFADGSIFTGEQALAKGMIDELGNFEDAILVAAKLAGIKDEPDIYKDYNPFERFMDMFGQTFEERTMNKLMSKGGLRLEYIVQ